ncbi:FecR family protein [Fodinibius sediminis]|uniref:FecR family protein n=1 Tax=Fodinibius sediminis TaxID=1214077 RepID=A0A521DR85_9BACT|nr:FecR domain-containing protein [Fodinibius sediminis]SMO73440.1 FecR family protein [Fodinibius sediminis]
MAEYEQEIEELLTDDSFIRWIEGRASEVEAAVWERWLENDPARKQLVEESKLLHRSMAFSRNRRSEVELELDRLKERMGREKKAAENGIRSRRISRDRTYPGMAAALIIMLVAVMGVLSLSYPGLYTSEPTARSVSKFITQKTQNGQQKKLTLSDGSTITLNSNSSLKYPSTRTGGDLEVWLDGEAYFDVAHKTGAKARSFTVHIPGGQVRVLGTTFNVNTYEEAAEVVLVKGKVKLEKKNRQGRDVDSHVMEPGELSRISELREGISSQRVDAERYTSWTRGKMIFDRTPLHEVAERVEHIYGVEFPLPGQELKQIRISGSLPIHNLEVFLNTIENMLNRTVVNRNGRIILGKEK